MAERVQPLDLTLLQFAVLMTVLEHPALTQSAIGQRFDAPAYAISRALDALEARGLVERRVAPASRRAFEVHPTEAGQALAPDLMGMVQEANGAFTAGLSDQENAQLLHLLTRLMADTETPSNQNEPNKS